MEELIKRLEELIKRLEELKVDMSMPGDIELVCSNCNTDVEPIALGHMCPNCACDM